MPHHITQRGNRRQPAFFCEEDYLAYVELMGQWCDERGVAVWAYCLMPNHVHLIAVPKREDSLRRAVGEAHRRIRGVSTSASGGAVICGKDSSPPSCWTSRRRRAIPGVPRHERTGRVLGDDDFQKRLEKKPGRVLRRQKPSPKKGSER